MRADRRRSIHNLGLQDAISGLLDHLVSTVAIAHPTSEGRLDVVEFVGTGPRPPICPPPSKTRYDQFRWVAPAREAPHVPITANPAATAKHVR
jgi:hypothetical protein